MVEQAGGADSDRRDRHHQPARDDRVLGQDAPASRWRPRSSGRTAAPPRMCRELKEAGTKPTVQARTGLLLDPYFSGSKIGWAMANWPQLKEAGDRLAVGTIECWLVWKLTGGLHITDATNASRTALMAIGSGHWDDGLIDLFDAPARRLARDRRLRRALRRDDAVRRADPDLRHGRRPAGGDDRPGVPRPRRHQGDLRHRRVRPDAIWREAADLEATACSRRSRGSWTGAAPMRWKDRCSSRAA